MRLILDLLAAYLLPATAHATLFSVAGAAARRPGYDVFAAPRHRIGVLVPAYREDAVIVSSATSLTELDYPPDLYEVVIIADTLQPDTLRQLAALPVRVIEVSFEQSTKAKALNAAMAQLPNYDLVVVSDADNVLAKNFLNYVDTAFQRGTAAFQGRRVAKNLNTPTAVLDAYSEAVNNHIFRQGANALGLSAALIGSGMAFRYSQFRSIMGQIDAIGGFDRVLQLMLAESATFVEYEPRALAYDEKVSNPTDLQRQRRRWVAVQFKYFRKYGARGWQKLREGNPDYFNRAVVDGLLPNKILTLGALGVGAVATRWVPQLTSRRALWQLMLAAYLLAVLLPAKDIEYRDKLLKTLPTLPRTLLAYLSVYAKLRGADQQFLHTPHSTNTVSHG